MPDVADFGAHRRIALLGGIYSNYLALERALELAKEARVDEVFALGDFGAFGPHPDRTVELLRGAGIRAIQGNYEESLSTAAEDCHCGYVDPRDNHYAQLSYDYTRQNTAEEHKRWMGSLPRMARLRLGAQRVLLSHGSPRRINEFLWETTTPTPFVKRLLGEHDADLIACTHTGVQWSRMLDAGRGLVNVGALGRPPNDGRTEVWFAILDADGDGVAAGGDGNGGGAVVTTFVPVAYDHARLAREMRAESLPEEFAETIESGYWTTCLEVLPAKERARGKY